MRSILQNGLSGSSAVSKMSRPRSLKPLTALAAFVSVAALLFLCGLTTLFQEASAGYRPYPHYGGGGYGHGGGRFGPGGRGPIPYGPGRFGQGYMPHGPHGLGGFHGGGPGPVIMPGRGGPHGGLGPHRGPPLGGPVDFNSASHWSNFGPSHQYPSVPMGNLQGQPGGGPGLQLPSSQEPSAEVATEGTTSSSSNSLKYMTQDETGLSNQAPSSNTWYESGAEGSSEAVVAQGMGIEDAPSDEIEHEEANDANPPKERSSNNGFLALRDDSKKEQEKADAHKQEALKAKKEKAHREELEKKPAKKAEGKKEEEPRKEEAKKEDANEEEPSKALDTEEPAEKEEVVEKKEGGGHRVKSHKKVSHKQEYHKEESHEEERSGV